MRGRRSRLSAARDCALRAADAEDLAVISACLQDALVSVRDLAYDPAARTFVLVANRFRWEGGGTDARQGAPFERILCGVAFDAVDGAAYRGFHRSEEDRILSLLAIRSAPGPAGTTPAGAIDRTPFRRRPGDPARGDRDQLPSSAILAKPGRPPGGPGTQLDDPA